MHVVLRRNLLDRVMTARLPPRHAIPATLPGSGAATGPSSPLVTVASPPLLLMVTARVPPGPWGAWKTISAVGEAAVGPGKLNKTK